MLTEIQRPLTFVDAGFFSLIRRENATGTHDGKPEAHLRVIGRRT